LKKLIQLHAIAVIGFGCALATPMAFAQPSPNAQVAPQGGSKRMYTGNVFEVIGTVTSVQIVNEEGSLAGASPNMSYRVTLNPTTRRNVTLNTVIGSGNGPYCGVGSGYFAYVNSNEPLARAIYSQAMVAKLTGEPLQLWVEADVVPTGPYCHIYLIGSSG
jgi:hypothetical protein